MTIHVQPILNAEIPWVADFLHREMNARVAPSQWEQALRVPFTADPPNHGFCLRDGDTIVGAILAFYSERTIEGRSERFCNIGAWCVLPHHRLRAFRLLRAVLAQPGYHFVDLSPSGAVVPLNEKLGFQHLDTTTALLPCLPWMGRATVVNDPEAIPPLLSGADRVIFEDHRLAAAAHHVVLHDSAGGVYIMYRRDRRKDLPLFVSVLHVSDPAAFRRIHRAFGAYVLRRHRAPALLAERRVTGSLPGSRPLPRSRPKMFRSDTLGPEAIDNLYSELCTVPW